MSDQATERVFQNDIIKQMLVNCWQLGQPEKYNRELVLYYEMHLEEFNWFCSANSICTRS